MVSSKRGHRTQKITRPVKGIIDCMIRVLALMIKQYRITLIIRHPFLYNFFLLKIGLFYFFHTIHSDHGLSYSNSSQILRTHPNPHPYLFRSKTGKIFLKWKSYGNIEQMPLARIKGVEEGRIQWLWL